jgi:hypothetical protein
MEDEVELPLTVLVENSGVTQDVDRKVILLEKAGSMCGGATNPRAIA